MQTYRHSMQTYRHSCTSSIVVHSRTSSLHKCSHRCECMHKQTDTHTYTHTCGGLSLVIYHSIFCTHTTGLDVYGTEYSYGGKLLFVSVTSVQCAMPHICMESLQKIPYTIYRTDFISPRKNIVFCPAG